MRICLGGDPVDNAVRLPARWPSASTRDEEGRGVVLPFLQPFFQDLARVSMQRHNIPDYPAFGLDAGKPLTGVLMPIEVEDFRDPQAGAEQRRKQCMIAQALFCSWSTAD